MKKGIRARANNLRIITYLFFINLLVTGITVNGQDSMNRLKAREILAGSFEDFDKGTITIDDTLGFLKVLLMTFKWNHFDSQFF